MSIRLINSPEARREDAPLTILVMQIKRNSDHTDESNNLAKDGVISSENSAGITV